MRITPSVREANPDEDIKPGFSDFEGWNCLDLADFFPHKCIIHTFFRNLTSFC